MPERCAGSSPSPADPKARSLCFLPAGVVLAAPNVPAFVSGVGCCAAFPEDGAAGAEFDCFGSFSGVVAYPEFAGAGVRAVGSRTSGCDADQGTGERSSRTKPAGSHESAGQDVAAGPSFG